MITDDKQLLEDQANRIRQSLLAKVDELDRRRHELEVMRDKAVEMVPRVAIAAGAMLVAVAGAVAYGIVQSRRRRREKGRLGVLAELLENPDRAIKRRRPSVLSQIGRKVLLMAAGVVIHRAVNESLRKLTTPVNEPPKLLGPVHVAPALAVASAAPVLSAWEMQHDHQHRR
jgi:hypothetical protein